MSWRRAATAPIAVAYLGSIAAALLLALHEGARADAWRDLWHDPQTARALGLSVGTALAGSAIALAFTLVVVTHAHGTAAWRRIEGALAPMLAVPHVAFAIGFALLVMPAGLIARLIAPFAGWDSPPSLPTVNDPHGLALVAVLALKELPFLLWNAGALLARPEVAAALRRQIAIGRTLGYTRAQLWWRVLWPQWLPRLGWPLVAVLAYGLTVVDVSLVVGPAAPPTLAVLAWQWLTDANAARNAQGAAAALLLAAVLAALVAVARALALLFERRLWRALARRGDRHAARPVQRVAGAALAPAAIGVYALVLLMLLAMSWIGVWSFPAVLPQSWTAGAWRQVGQSLPVLAVSAGLGLLAAATSLALAVLWLEGAPPAWDAPALPFVVLPIVLPSLLVSAGLYRGALEIGLAGSLAGLWWAHTLMSLPYLLLALAPAWRSFDRRYEWAALALGRSRAAFFWRVKVPLLGPPLAAALAVGFAVSIAQYLPTQFVGAGRHATVTTEAVTLAAGGQRHAAAAWALLQALLPALGFAFAHRLARLVPATGPSVR